jgi:large subunit ribosomal protein L25
LAADMAGERIRLEVRERDGSGSRAARRLRREGLVPGVLYGRGRAAHAIVVPERELRRVLTADHGLHAILDVVLEGQKSAHPSVLKDYQQDPLRGRITHFDLQEVRLDQPIQAQVTVELVGEAPGVTEGGVLSQVAREVTVEALPMEMPDRIQLDVGAAEMGATLRVADLPSLDGATVLDDPETVVATITAPTRVVEPEAEVEEAEEVEGEAPEGEEAPSAEGAAPGEAQAEAPAPGGGEAETAER